MHFTHYGCKVNQYETNAMAQKFIEANNEVVGFEEKADVYIINTCTVTNMADRKSRQILRRTKQINPEGIVVAIGCYAQTHKKELEDIEEFNLVLGNNEKNNIVEIVSKYLNEAKGKNEVQVEDIDKQKEFLDFGTITYTDKTRAVIKIQDGCNNFCSYCLIPYARGRVRSRKKGSILEEIKRLAENGEKEVVITGIHIASYGNDFEEDYKLIDLLEDINKIDGIERIRLGSLEPKIITEEFTGRLSKLDKICNHFHLSLQSGCDETLKRMNRKYNTEEFEKGVNLLRQYFENVALTADVIVGFPGETNQEFEKTYEFLEKIKFMKTHVFKYSPREGTRAANMPDQIDGNIKEQRSRKLIELSDKNEKEFLEKQIGTVVKVLFEQKEDKYWKGHTTNYLTVKKEAEDLENKLLEVKIKSRENLELIAE